MGDAVNTKSSATLRFLETHEVFSLGEYLSTVDPTVSERTRYGNLQNALKRGQAYRVTRALYASNLGVYRDRAPNVLLVAAKAAPDGLLTHHSALDAHGVAHTPFRTVYFTSVSRMKPFEVRGYRFRRVAPPATVRGRGALGDFVTQVRTGDALVRAATKERTLVDCLSRPALAGGPEELFRSLGGFTSVSAERVYAYSRLLGSPTLTARAGWVLGMMAEPWGVDQVALSELQRSLGRGTYWLERRRPQIDYKFVAQWRLYVPSGPPFEEWLRG